MVILKNLGHPVAATSAFDAAIYLYQSEYMRCTSTGHLGRLLQEDLIGTPAQKQFASQLVTERNNFSSVNPEALHRY